MWGMDRSAVTMFAPRLGGSVVAPWDDEYDAARSVWNGMVNKRPALVVNCQGVGDVQEAVDFARSHDLAVSVRSAGHHVAGSSVLESGLVLDVSAMRGVSMDAANRRVRAEGGALIGDVDRATQEHGLAVPLGLVSATGVAGLSLAGGYGFLRRKHGLSCDNMLAVELVTADGREVRASSDEEPELFWALRGGGWDLGVVTAIEYQAHPVGPEVFMPFITYPLAEGRRVLAGLAEFVRDAPREAGMLAVCWTFPDNEEIPSEARGQQFVGVAGPYAGDPAEGERVLAPLSELGPVLTDFSDRTQWLDAQQFFDPDYPRGGRYYWKSSHLTGLGPDSISTLLELAASRPSQASSLDVWFNGGAIADVPADATPISTRHLPCMIGIEANWTDQSDDQANRAWANDVSAALKPFASGGAYLNFDDLSDPDAARRAHGANFDRLAAVKRHYDPDYLFRSRTGVVGAL